MGRVRYRLKKILTFFNLQYINKERLNSLENELRFQNVSFSQEGEDLFIDRLFGSEESGYYVDVGALHPIRFSNTYKFYRRGWRGINIDPMPNSMDLFKILRPDDINLEIGISEEEGVLDYYIFNEPALNTFSKKEADKKNKEPYKIIDKKEIKVFRLVDVFDEHLPKGVSITFLDVDVEGFDLKVLKSNDWNKYRPKIVLAEALRVSSLEEIVLSPVFEYMKSVNYSLIGKTFNTMFFKDNIV